MNRSGDNDHEEKNHRLMICDHVTLDAAMNHLIMTKYEILLCFQRNPLKCPFNESIASVCYIIYSNGSEIFRNYFHAYLSIYFVKRMYE